MLPLSLVFRAIWTTESAPAVESADEFFNLNGLSCGKGQATSRLRNRWLGAIPPASPPSSRLPSTAMPKSPPRPLLLPSKMDCSKTTFRRDSHHERASSENRSSSPAAMSSEVLMKMTFWYGSPLEGSTPMATPSIKMFPRAFSPALISINPNCPPSSTDGEPPAMRIKLPLMLMASLIVNC